MSSTELIKSLIKEIQEKTLMSYDDLKNLLSMLFEKMKNCDNDTVTEAVCMEL